MAITRAWVMSMGEVQNGIAKRCRLFAVNILGSDRALTSTFLLVPVLPDQFNPNTCASVMRRSFRSAASPASPAVTKRAWIPKANGDRAVDQL
jgi:hypothetical protein